MAILNILLAIFLPLAMQVTAVRLPKSCEEVLMHFAGAKFMQGEYTIDPDGAGGVDPFQVTCTTSDDLPGHGVTLVPHQGGITPQPMRYRGPGSYARQVRFTYKPTTAQLDSLTKISSKCRQFVQLIAYKALNFVTSTWWVSRQGTSMKNWGGAPTNSGKCACAVQGRCDLASKRCNCHINDYVWRMDAGYLDDKRYLPVKQVPIRDVDNSHEEVYLTVKPMECYGATFNGQQKERCQCSFHAEEKSKTTAGPLLLQLPDLIYGQGKNDVWIDDGIRTRRVTDVYANFFSTKKRRHASSSTNVHPGTSPECAHVLQRCPVDCERLAKFNLASKSLATKISVGGVQKPLGQVMCENAKVTLPPPGRRIVAFYKTVPTCGSGHSSTHVFSDDTTICCAVFRLPYTNQVYNVFNEKCSRTLDLNTVLSG